MSGVPKLGPDDEPAECLPAGTIVGRYRIDGLLALGGHGAVYAAEHVELGYPVAVKVMERCAGLDPRRRARFRREAQLGARLRHRNLVSIFEAGELDDGSPYLVMELIEGTELGRVIEAEGPLDPKTAVELGVQLLGAVAALWEHGIVHRDIKPQNVMLRRTADGSLDVKLLDLGIVKTLRAGSSPSLTDEGFVLGTPQYMSPEQIRGQELDVRSDVFAVGVVLYEAMAGRPPIDAESADAALMNVLVETPMPLSERNRACPADLAAVIMGAMSKSPAARWQSPPEMARALRRCAHRRGGPSVDEARRATSFDSRVAARDASQRWLPTPPERPTAIRLHRRTPRHRPPWWPAAALLALLLLGLAWNGLSGRRALQSLEPTPATAR